MATGAAVSSQVRRLEIDLEHTLLIIISIQYPFSVYQNDTLLVSPTYKICLKNQRTEPYLCERLWSNIIFSTLLEDVQRRSTIWGKCNPRNQMDHWM